jgi:outer membrane lipoprotein-sorting protein
MIEGSPYNKLIAVNGEALTATEAKREEQKLEQETKRRRSESPSTRQKRMAQYQKERREDHALMSEMIKAFDFTLTGEGSVNGRRCFALEAKPKPSYKPISRDTQVLKGMRGQMWVDAEQYQWVRVHAEVFRTVSFGLFFAQVKPGTEFTLEQKPVEGNLWLPGHFLMTVKARVLLSSRASADDEVYSNYRRAGAVKLAHSRQ